MQCMDFNLHGKGFPQETHEKFQGNGVHGIGMPPHVREGSVDVRKGKGAAFPDQGIDVLDQTVCVGWSDAFAREAQEKSCAQVCGIGIGRRCCQIFFLSCRNLGFLEREKI